MADDPLAPYRMPVSADTPAGEDLTYDEAYMRIREEVDRMGTVSVHVDHESGAGGGGDGVDFGEIATEARSLLMNRTRDLQLAAYLTIALARSSGAEGLAEGLGVARVLAESFGADVHPVRPVRRRNALQFLADRSKEWAADQKFGASDVEALERASATAEAIQAWATANMGEDAPALSGLRQAIDEALRRASRAQKATEAPPSDGAPAPAAAPAAGGELALASVSDARRAVLRVCSFLREQDPASPVPYRLGRAILWGGIVAAPPGEGGKTLIEPPDAVTRSQLQSLAAGPDPMALLRAAEDAFSARPLWLDLQRMGAQGAERGGPAHEAILRAIESATAELVGRVPALAALTFSDGSPMADPTTQAWLESLAPDASASGPNESPGDDPLAEVLDQARALAAKGDLGAGVRALQDAPAGRAGGRTRLRRGLHVARLCVQGGQAAVAAALLDGLAVEADRRGLDEWEPALALELWRALHAARSAAAAEAPPAGKDDARRRVAEAYERVCRIDPAAGLALPGPGTKT